MQLATQTLQFSSVSVAPTPPSRVRGRLAIIVDEVVFRKSVAGHNEVEHRHMMLRPELRRLLILLDGHTSFEQFAPMFREGDLPKLVDELLALGLVESVSTSPLFEHATVNDVLSRARSLSPAQFESARRAALHAASELLGRIARPYCDRIADCADSAQFRVVVDDISAKMNELIGSDAVTLFIETVRDAAKARA